MVAYSDTSINFEDCVMVKCALQLLSNRHL